MSLAAYAGAGVLLWRLARTINGTQVAAGVLLILFTVDTKIVDFSTNGMETGFLVLFLAWTLHALLTAPRQQALHLGLAWAGLMWTRPDSFVYIGALAVGTLAFCPPASSGGGRVGLLRTFFAAGAITTVLYAPWIIWAWSYYGTPVPHTITAKGLFHAPVTPLGLIQAAWDFPRAVTAHLDMLAATFMPPYGTVTGWPTAMLKTTHWIALGTMVVWLLPGIRRETRLASFVFCVGEFYITSFVAFPVPWYIPTLTVFSLMVLCGLIGQAADAIARLRKVSVQPFWLRSARLALPAVSTLLIAGSLTITVLAAHQLRYQEEIIEHGQRREIGRWLREHAASRHDSVFLEPLGYIGFYSNLKMFDFPGLCSPEVVAARKITPNRSYPDCWPALILELSPNWLVLRNYEADAIRRVHPDVLEKYYSLARIFDVQAQVTAIPFIMGRGYLMNDAYFLVYKRNFSLTRDGIVMARVKPITAATLEKNDSWSQPAYDSGANLIAHAPSRLAVKKPPGARWLSGQLGIFEGAYKDYANSTDGAEFSIVFSADPSSPRQELFRRALNPRDVASDRGLQSFSVELPAAAEGTVEFVISPGPKNNDAYDWTYWSSLRFEFPKSN